MRLKRNLSVEDFALQVFKKELRPFEARLVKSLVINKQGDTRSSKMLVQIAGKYQLYRTLQFIYETFPGAQEVK